MVPKKATLYSLEEQVLTWWRRERDEACMSLYLGYCASEQCHHYFCPIGWSKINYKLKNNVILYHPWSLKGKSYLYKASKPTESLIFPICNFICAKNQFKLGFFNFLSFRTTLTVQETHLLEKKGSLSSLLISMSVFSCLEIEWQL